ncbi:hypothetical protein BK133_14160 [Paenibacillus sp. FSL H8-0548]|uniref:hypothetical protein n=1 Tax=Paenibacillus sp. FSL H8-0548 TaxID=1920422 RepID=UPI00096D48B3|nr:hypothetical protein [Paenibacillus sp. FSL H8-0548]OMF32642.1 hypothetical protein BK133_14160 [Paenibacillus sp. FSL H8-0548]
MSAKKTFKVSNVKSTSRARITSNCSCKEHHKSCGCGRRVDPAVEAMQVAGKDLSDTFKQLKDEHTAAKLVKAIRCRDAKAVQDLLDCKCRVVCFFCTHDKDCVRICCAFGRSSDVTVSFDICVKRAQDQCHRKSWF